jgi:D-amino-acid dehydrogenase
MPYARALFPLGTAVEDKSWMGMRPCTSDGLPVIGAVPGYKKLWLNAGHGHIGMTTGPVTGRLLAEMMAAEKTFCDPAPYRPDRF